MEYFIQQKQERKNKNCSFPKINYVFLNDGNGLHTFLRGSTTLVGVGVLIVELSRAHSDIPHKLDRSCTSDRTVAETSN